MTNISRHLAILTVASLSLLAAGCKNPNEKAAVATADATAAATTDAGAIAGLPTEKERVSYMIGLDLAKSLEPVKGDVDLDTMHKALQTALTGGKTLMDEKQAQQVRESFGQKIQARAAADALAKAQKNLTEGQAFLTANAKKPNVKTTASGLQYEVLTQGKGAMPKASDAVSAHYKGALLDGKTFDSSYDRGQPATFVLTQVVPGWQEGITLMPVGSKYRFWLPASLGYGDKGTPGGPIGPNATLMFEVELLDIVNPATAPAP